MIPKIDAPKWKRDDKTGRMLPAFDKDRQRNKDGNGVGVVAGWADKGQGWGNIPGPKHKGGIK